jgi:hypothetical protein
MIAAFVENYVVLIYVNYLVVRQNDVFLEYINSLGPRTRGFSPIYGSRPAYDCAIKPFAKIYSYKLCAYDSWPGADSPEGLMVLVVIKPAGYFTLIPWNYRDRMIIDRELIFTFVGGEVKKRFIKD